jgi:[CysO sulfur-carrier protein]-S-L-cysteine hydrolase
VVIPAEVRSALVEHAEAETPNGACGLIALRDGVAERYIGCINTDASPYRFRLRAPNPGLVMDLWDDGYELAIFHSHLSSPPRPSRTDVENIGDYQGYPYIILSLRSGELAAWRIEDGRVTPEPLSS